MKNLFVAAAFFASFRCLLIHEDMDGIVGTTPSLSMVLGLFAVVELLIFAVLLVVAP